MGSSLGTLGTAPTEAELNRIRCLYDNFRYLTVFGGSYGFFHTTRWAIISLTVYVVMYTVMILGTLDLIYASYLVRSNISAFTQSFHVVLVGLVVLSASLTLTLVRPKLSDLYDFLASPHLCDYSKSSYHQMLDQEAKKKKNSLLILWVCSYGSCGLVGIINFMIDDHLGNELTLNITGVYWKKLPLIFWWPLDAHETTTGWITLLLFESLFAIFAPLMIISAIILCFNAFDLFLNQFKLLTHSISNLDQRARTQFKLKYPGRNPSDFDREYDSCYYECIKENIKHHHRIMQLMKLFRETASIPIGVPFFGGAMLLGLAGINLMTEDDPRIGPKMLLLALALSEALNMFLLCAYGEALQDESSKVYDATFYAKWHERSSKCRRAIVTFRCGTQRPVTITAIKLIVLDMKTFSNLVNSAYSIINLRSASASTESGDART